LFAIDRTSTFAFVELHEKATTALSGALLLRLIFAVPCTIHTVLTESDIQFTTPGAGGSAVPLTKDAIANGDRFWALAFEYSCATSSAQDPKAAHPVSSIARRGATPPERSTLTPLHQLPG
jgi:hypothetical protein